MTLDAYQRRPLRQNKKMSRLSCEQASERASERSSKQASKQATNGQASERASDGTRKQNRFSLASPGQTLFIIVKFFSCDICVARWWGTVKFLHLMTWSTFVLIPGGTFEMWQALDLFPLANQPRAPHDLSWCGSVFFTWDVPADWSSNGMCIMPFLFPTMRLDVVLPPGFHRIVKVAYKNHNFHSLTVRSLYFRLCEHQRWDLRTTTFCNIVSDFRLSGVDENVRVQNPFTHCQRLPMPGLTALMPSSCVQYSAVIISLALR